MVKQALDPLSPGQEVLAEASVAELARTSGYDARDVASPDDPEIHRLEELRPRFQIYWAIAKLLNPKTILEIGVGYGYSAHACLSAVPNAKYLGLERDVSGEAAGRVAWARTILQSFGTDACVADRGSVDELSTKHGSFDLVHITSEAGGDEVLEDLLFALNRSRHILLDICPSDRITWLTIADFLLRYRDLIRYYSVIAGGEAVLIETASPSGSTRGSAASSRDLQDAYTRRYYLQDCGGFEAYKRHGGKVFGPATLSRLRPGPASAGQARPGAGLRTR